MAPRSLRTMRSLGGRSLVSTPSPFFRRRRELGSGLPRLIARGFPEFTGCSRPGFPVRLPLQESAALPTELSAHRCAGAIYQSGPSLSIAAVLHFWFEKSQIAQESMRIGDRFLRVSGAVEESPYNSVRLGGL